MTKYVLGFMFDEKMNNIILIKKTHPKWQAGLWNGVGGRIEFDELSIQAMSREFKEETGKRPDPSKWKFVLTMHFYDCDVDVYAMNNDYGYAHAETKTDEIVRGYSVNMLPDTIENVPALITLCKQRMGQI